MLVVYIFLLVTLLPSGAVYDIDGALFPGKEECEFFREKMVARLVQPENKNHRLHISPCKSMSVIVRAPEINF
jgi:hypothetical protein